MEPCSPFKLGNCIVSPLENLIQHEVDGVVTSNKTMQPKFIELLCYLAKHSNRVISRHELIDNVWDGNYYVGEKALTNAIWHLRKQFTEFEQHDVIETIRKTGYKVTLEPTYLQSPTETQPNSTNDRKSNSEFSTRILAYLTLLLVLATLITNHWLDDKIEMSITAVTSEPGAELFVSPAPNGKSLVYAWSDEYGATNLYYKDLTQPKLPHQALTTDGLVQGMSTWSHDSKKLYFARKDKANNQCNIVELDIVALQEKALTSCSTSGGYYYIDVSFDGQLLAFNDKQNSDATSGIYLVDLKKPSSAPQRLSCQQNCQYKDRDFAFSPNSNLAAVTRRYGRFNENIYLFNLNTKEVEQVTFNEQDIVGISWHPDGNKLVYATQKSDVRRGYIYDLESKTSTFININGFSYPEFAKQSGDLFYQQRKEHYSIVKLELGNEVASSPYPVLQSVFSHHSPHYSTVTGQIVYVSNESGHYELWVADLNGKHRKQITNLQSTVRYPQWSHSGDKISFIAATQDGSGEKLHIFDLVKNRVQVIETNFTRHYRATWTANDNYLIAAATFNNRTELYQIELATNKTKKLTDNQGRFGILLNKDELVYSDVAKRLWRMNLAETDKVQQVLPAGSLRSTYSWFLVNEKLFYLTNRGEYAQLISIHDNVNTPLFQFPAQSFTGSSNISYVENNNTILFPQSALPQSDIMKLEHSLLK